MALATRNLKPWLVQNDVLGAPSRANEISGPDPLCEDNPLPRYPPGEYDVCCYAVRTYHDPRFKRWVCRLDCHFLTEEAQVCGFLNMGKDKTPKARRGSEYWRVWVMVTGVQPKRGRLPKTVFKGRFFRVKIDDTVKRYDKREHSDAARYSTIKEFLACVGP